MEAQARVDAPRQYRVWDEENRCFLASCVLLGPDGLLSTCALDGGPEPLTPRWFDWAWLKRYRKSGREHAPPERFWQLRAEQEQAVRAHQHEWYAVEFATGYPDQTTGSMSYAGDIVQADWCWTEPHALAWPRDLYDFVEFGLDLAHLRMLGNVHQHPHLLARSGRPPPPDNESASKPGGGDPSPPPG